MSVTAEIAQLICEPLELPPAALVAGRRAILDTIGVTLAGSVEEAVRMLRTVVAPAGPATLLGCGTSASALDAALLNATAAHALDYDDTHASFRGHPSATIVPAALAAAELVGASGAELVTAYVLGLEVAGRVGQSFGTSHAAQGFHSTGTLGVLGAAAASARLLGLDAEASAVTLGIAASSAAGLRANFGFMAKPLHAGNSARAGLLAALLAQRGFTATDEILDATRGFTESFSPGDGGPVMAGPVLDEHWQVLSPGIAVKKYPCCNRGHRAADAVLTLVRTHDFGAADVERIEVRMPAGEVDDQGRVGPMTYPVPETGLQAKFSMQYVIAAAVLDRALGVHTFTDEQVHRPEVRRLLALVTPTGDPSRPASSPESNYVEVVLTLTGGQQLRERVFFSRGDPRGGDPLTETDLAEKYLDCARTVLAGEDAEHSLGLLTELDELPDMKDLMATLGRSKIT